MQLIQTCIIYYCFLVVKEFNNLVKIDIISGFFVFNFHPAGAIYPGQITYFFNHINLDKKLIPVNIYI